MERALISRWVGFKFLLDYPDLPDHGASVFSQA
jgi:hypothetical protein